MTTQLTILPSALIPLRRFDTKKHRHPHHSHPSPSHLLCTLSPHLIHYNTPYVHNCSSLTPGYFQSCLVPFCYLCRAACAQHPMSKFLQDTPHIYTHDRKCPRRNKEMWCVGSVSKIRRFSLLDRPSCDGVLLIRPEENINIQLTEYLDGQIPQRMFMVHDYALGLIQYVHANPPQNGRQPQG